MSDGILRDFFGDEIKGHAPEWPTGCEAGYFPIAEPLECSLVGMKIRSYFAIGGMTSRHPVICLHDRWGHIVKRWPENFTPSLDDIRQSVKDALVLEGRKL